MKKPRFTRSVLVVLDDGCMWLSRARLLRVHGCVRVHAESGVVFDVPAAAVIGSVSYAPRARNKPEPVARLEDIVDELQLGFDKELWRVLEERRRNPRPVPHEVVRELIRPRVDRRRRSSL
jgi:hypothetical protein